MKKTILLSFTLLFFWSTHAQKDLSYYFEENVSFDPSIPTPEEVLGYQVGQWHVNHDQLSKYMNILAKESDRVSISSYAKTYEDRKLWLVKFTSAQNQANLENIRQNHISITAGTKKDISNLPVVVWMGYSVHGNESSGTNASLLMAYYLAAAQGPEIEKVLSETIVLMDPMINPDGNMRFSTWANSHKSKNLSADPQNIEQNEMWPGGRTNHYWFDLNRDWLLLQHPESRGRIKQLHRWKPNVLTDHHEMGTNATFFFQPGIPSRNNPLTPEKTFYLTYKLAQYHIEGLDEIGSLYYSKESFDDFYYGKGSTYPDVNGGVGILFEQASSRGHAQESINGVVEFPFTIKNQLATSLSTLKGAHALRKELLEHQNEFYSSASGMAKTDPVKAFVVQPKNDKYALYHMLEVIQRHDIDIFKLQGQLSVSGKTFSGEDAYIIPTDQPQYRLIKALFEERTTFQDSLFYDVSAWTFPHAYNVQFGEVKKSVPKNQLGSVVSQLSRPVGKAIGGVSDPYAYLFEWDDYFAPKALYQLQKHDYKTKVATQPFTTATGKAFSYGTIMVPLGGLSKQEKSVLAEIVEEIQDKDGIDIYSVSSGESIDGPYLGSNNFAALQQPKIAMIIEGGVSSYESGEAWHLLDQRMNIDVSMLRMSSVGRYDLSKYNVLVMVNGNYNSLNDRAKDKLKEWVRNGGTIVATKRAVTWLASNEFTKVKTRSAASDSSKTLPYSEVSPYFGAQVIGGAIFNTRLDPSHPICYGYKDSQLAVFRNSTLFLEPQDGIAANPVLYTSNPLLAGYISDRNEKTLANSAAVTVSSFGRGRIISMSDNPNFRAYFLGTNKLFLNSIFFGRTINGNSLR